MNNLISSLLIFSLTSSLSAQNTLYVPDDFSSIQDGINGIQNGDTLIVRDGVYNENINFNGKAIEIRSENGLATTTLDGTNTGKSLVRFDSGESALSLLKGFTIKNGYPVWQSVQNGSGAFITGSSSPTIENCAFEDNYGAGYGGAVYCEQSSSPTLINCSFTNNVASIQGGGMFCKDSSSPILRDCVFTQNYLNGGQTYGGGIAIVHSSPTLDNCAFVNNDAWTGGGVHIEQSNSAPSFVNCLFESNSSSWGGGGAVSSVSSLPSFENCIFDTNYSYGGAGAIDISAGSNGQITILDCIFETNQSSGESGGAISIRSWGANNYSTIIGHCEFNNNSSQTGGGGISCVGDDTTVIDDCLFANNTVYGSGSGGAILCDNSSPQITNSTFNLNWAEVHGGAFYLHDLSSPTITNCLISNNGSQQDGGGIFCDYASSPTLTNCTVTENSSASYGGGLFAGLNSQPNFDSCIIWNNHSNGTAGGIKIDSSSSLSASYSTIEGGWSGTGNISLDPLFVDSANEDFRLNHIGAGQPTDSPCIDSGNPGVIPFGTTRTDGLADITIVDIGYHLSDIFIDSDSDGLEDYQEISYFLTNPFDQDTDDDGLSDGEEVLSFSTDPLSIDSDSDGIQDGTEMGLTSGWAGDPGNNILGTDIAIFIADSDPATTTDPLDDDTDDDGLMDGQEDANQNGEFLGIELDPNNFDGDNDGLGDGLELGLVAPNGNDTDMTVFVADSDPSTTTRATFRDTDGGGIHDGLEDANRNGMIDAGEIDPRDASDDSVYMKISPMVEGGSVTFSYLECEPGSLMVLCYSLVGPGPTFFTNLTLDLSQPIGSRPPIPISASGTAQLGPVPIPPNIIVGDQLWFQGVQVSLFGSASSFTTTNMIPVTVQ
jgi:parallel beta-helix repeat protein/predicted outer membrane repeat protein